MESIHLKTEIVKDQSIPLPKGVTVPLGPAEVIVIPQASTASEAPPSESSAEEVPRVPQIAIDLARFAEQYKDQISLPSDYAINHDHYLHGAPKWIDLK